MQASTSSTLEQMARGKGLGFTPSRRCTHAACPATIFETTCILIAPHLWIMQASPCFSHMHKSVKLQLHSSIPAARTRRPGSQAAGSVCRACARKSRQKRLAVCQPWDAHLTSREPGGGTRMCGSCCPTASVPVSSRSASAPVDERTARKSPPARHAVHSTAPTQQSKHRQFGTPHDI